MINYIQCIYRVALAVQFNYKCNSVIYVIEELGAKVCKDFFSQVPLRCWLAVCCWENDIVMIKQSVFPRKKKQNLQDLNLDSSALISAGGKMLNTCAMQAPHGTMGQI